MSLGDTGQFGGYTPPPPPAAKKSPWLYIGIGCGAIVALSFVGCIGGVAFFANKARTEMAKPLDKNAVMKSLADTPVYPGATLEEKSTKGARVGMNLMKGMMAKTGQSMAVAAFVTADDDSKILPWYDKKMPELGYHATQIRANSGTATAEQHAYQKGNVVVLVQIPSTTTKASFILMRMTGAKIGAAGKKADTDD